MACKIQIRENLNNEIRIKAKPLEGASLNVAKKMANDINKSYNYKVVSVFEGPNDYTNKVVVSIPEEMIDKYHEYFTKLEEEEARIAQREDAERAGEEYDDRYMFQLNNELSNKTVTLIAGDYTNGNIEDYQNTFNLKDIQIREIKDIKNSNRATIYFQTKNSKKFGKMADDVIGYMSLHKIGNIAKISDVALYSPININNKIGERKVNEGKGVGRYLYNLVGKTLNEDYGLILQSDDSISIGANRIWRYLESVNKAKKNNNGTYEYVDNNNYQQISEQSMSKASPETLAKVKEAAKKMGISIQRLSDYLKGNPTVNTTGVNALTDLTRRVIAVSEGKEDVALTEEMVHTAFAIIEQTNPKLATEMISKIGRFGIYKRTLDTYKSDANYQLSSGKPDIRKIKIEAVGKLIAELIINQNEGNTEFPELRNETERSSIRTWWQKVLDWIKGMYRKTNIDVFEETAGIIMDSNFGTSANISSEGIFLQKVEYSDKQKAFQKKIMDTQNIVKNVPSKESPEPILMDNDDATNWYELLLPNGTWQRIKKRVTDRVKDWYNRRFPDRKFSEEEKRDNELKRELGIKYHGYFKEIHSRFFNPDGTRREKTLGRPHIQDKLDEEVYIKLEKYFISLMNRHFKNGRVPLVFSEIIVYDPVEKEAGTLDLLLIDKDGTASVYDWKFMNISEDSNDVPWFKQGAFNIQLGRYKDILIDRYGITNIDRNRAIPFLLNMEREDKKDYKSKLFLKGITMGSVDPKQIEDLRLAPVSEETESTGEEKLDNIIGKLNSILKNEAGKKATSEEEYDYKRERMNILRMAIRHLQSTYEVQPLIDVISIMRKEGELIINDWESKYKDRPATIQDSENKELSDFADNMREYIAIADVFKNADKIMGELIYKPGDELAATTKEEKADVEERKKVLEKIREEASLIYNLDEVIKGKVEGDLSGGIAGQFANKFIGERNSVTGLLRPEAIIKGLTKIFTGVSELPTASTKILWKLVSNATGKAGRDAIAEVDKLLAIRKRLVERGGSTRDLIKSIYQKDDKNKPVNKLIYRYSKEFYDKLKENAKEGARDKDWLKENVDLEAYWKEAEKVMNDKIKRHEKIYSENITLRDKLIKEERQKWDVTRRDFTGFDNYIIRRHPLEKWESEEYKRIKKDRDLFDLYNFIHDINEKAMGVGYISNIISSTFLPFVRKSFAESLAWDFSLPAISNWSKKLQMRAGDTGYGEINELTKEYEYSIPKYYTHDFTRGEDGVNDYSDVSEDLFKNLILYINHMEKYKYLSDIEGQIQLVRTLETFKDHLNTAKNGDVIFKDGKPDVVKGNEETTKMFDIFMRALLYDQKYPLSDSDAALGFGKAVSFMKEAVNKVAGRQVFDMEKDKPTPSSMIKSIDALNRAMQIKTLGFEVVSGAANIFGANIQALAQSGNYFKGTEFIASEAQLVGNRFKNDDERNMFLQLVDTFLPLKEEAIYKRQKRAGLSLATRASMTDFLMMFMKYPEEHVEKSIFLTLLKNTMVVDGKLENIREYVRKKYPNRDQSAARYKRETRLIEDEVKTLKDTKSIYITKKLENGKLVIPGLDLNNKDELQRLTTLTRRISRAATGDMSDADINQMSMNIWTKSMMVFKNWIPKLVMTRFGSFRRVGDDFSVLVGEDEITTGEKYDIGRVRLWGYVLGTSIRDLSMNIYNILELNDKGMEALDKMYEEFGENFKKRNGYEMTITKAEFIDLIRSNLSNQMKELAMLLSLLGAGLALGFIGPDDDEGKAEKNLHRYTQKVVDKFINELSFFYNPVEFQKLLSGSTFPAIGLVTDILRFGNHLTLQLTGYDISNPELTYEEVREKAQPIKYGAKMFPFTKAALTYGAILSDDFAEEFDITIQKAMR